MMQQEPPKWNIFVRELEDILEAYGHKLGYLTNIELYQDDGKPLVHPQKLDRMRTSLTNSNQFPTMLNPDELQKVIAIFKFNEFEIARLRTAILATSVQRTLQERKIDAEHALKAADAVYYILLPIFHATPDIEGIRHPNEQRITMTTLENPWNPVINVIDYAVLEWHLSRETGTIRERTAHARQAKNAFESAKKSLNEMAVHDEQWHLWNNETQNGLTASNRLIKELEGIPLEEEAFPNGGD
jgi:hypothetical protein